MKNKVLITMAACLFIATGCSSNARYVAPPAPPPITPQFVNLTTPNVKITAADNSWEIITGTPFKPGSSFKIFSHSEVKDLVKNINESSSDFMSSLLKMMGKSKKAVQPLGLIRTTSVASDLAYYNSDHIKNSVMDVKVDDGSGSTLYGKIIFSKVHSKSTSSSAKRMWTVSVPQSYLNTAKSGNVAVLYQPYKVSGAYQSELVSWVLWISKLPL